jgi:hypothetical protein
MFDWSQPVQASFSELEYAAKKRKMRRDRFLAEIEALPQQDPALICHRAQRHRSLLPEIRRVWNANRQL